MSRLKGCHHATPSHHHTAPPLLSTQYPLPSPHSTPSPHHTAPASLTTQHPLPSPHGTPISPVHYVSSLSSNFCSPQRLSLTFYSRSPYFYPPCSPQVREKQKLGWKGMLIGTSFLHVQKGEAGAGRKAHWLRALVVLVEDQSSNPST